MSQSSLCFADRSVVLVAGVKTAVTVPAKRQCSLVDILNGTNGDLQVHTTDTDNAHYYVIAAGFNRPMPPVFDARIKLIPLSTIVWLYSLDGGQVVLLWY